MAENSLLSLRWNNHVSNFKYTLGQLQEKELYSDATIACEGNFYPVHKFVLSTCSDYFASVFEHTPCKHPVIILKDTNSKDIQLLLSYMYSGEVSVSQVELPNLIKAADALQIKGLVVPDEPPTGMSSPEKTNRRRSTTSCEDDDEQRNKRTKLNYSNDCEIKKEIEPETCISESEDTVEDQSDTEKSSQLPSLSANDVNDINPTLYESNSFSEMPLKQDSDSNMLPSMDCRLSSHESLEMNSNQQTPNRLSTGECPPWQNFSSAPTTLNNGFPNAGGGHSTNSLYTPREPAMNVDVASTSSVSSEWPSGSNREASAFAIASQSHTCPMCPKNFQSRADVVRHLRTHTGEKPFSCPHCNYRAALKGNLKSHIMCRHPNLYRHEPQ